MDVPILSIMLLYYCRSVANSFFLYHGPSLVTENISWYETKLFEYPVLRFRVDFKISFPVKECCPVLGLINNLKDRYDILQGRWFSAQECYYEDIFEGYINWYKSSTFKLSTETFENGNCVVNRGYYNCTVSTTVLNYEPKLFWMVFAYQCHEKRPKSLFGLRYEYTAKLQNTTQCEPLQIPQDEDFYFQCDKFYNFVSFPNVFGDTSQLETFKFLQVFQTAIRSATDSSCHKHLNYIVCQAFFPRCPAGTSINNDTASHIAVICEKTCEEIILACSEAFQPLTNFVDCSYYRNASRLETDCLYQEVTCSSPPKIENGRMNVTQNRTYSVGSKVRYSCSQDYKLKGNATSQCRYSGTWTSPPECESSVHVKILFATVPCGIALLILFIVALYFGKRKQKLKRTKIYFENQPVKKRNREYDAFISYTSAASIDFVKTVLYLQLEVESNPPFKLFVHTRDFHAATLIYVNILEAIQKSNCAIILMSQEYIDAPWCREEFQECVEESKRDPAFKLFVIMMQPKETLKGFTAYMDRYFRSKTYLTRDDPQLLTKLTKYLSDLRDEQEQVEKSDSDVEY